MADMVVVGGWHKKVTTQEEDRPYLCVVIVKMKTTGTIKNDLDGPIKTHITPCDFAWLHT
jgi:hypothetical protein